MKLNSITYLGGFYKPPDAKVENFLVKLDIILEKFDNLFCCGDFNINLFSGDNKVKKYIDTTEANGFRFLNSRSLDMFTRHDQLHGTKSCIDHIFTDIFQKYKFNIAVENILQVDHHAVMLNVSHLNKQSHKVASKYITFTFTDHDKIINSKILTKAPTESFNTLIDFIKNEIQKNTSTKSYKERFRKSFMNVNIYNFMKIRDNYLKLLTKYPNIQWITDTFKEYRNLVNKLIRQEKKKKNDEFFLNNLSDPKKTWKKINSLLTNTNMMKMENCVKLKIDDIVVDNRFQIADEFNKHFVMVAKNIKDIIASKIINSTSFQSLDDYEIKHQFDFPLSDENEILNVISNLKSSNARDIFELSNNTGRRRLEYFTENSLDIKLYDQKIERVENYKYLGLFIDESLSFIKHIENIKSKILPMAYAIKRIRPLISEKISLQLYFANIHSHLTFMNPLWSVATNLALNTLFIIQKKCLRFIKMKTRLSPSHELFSENILPLPALNNYQLILLAFKLKNQLLKNNIKLNYVGDIHSYGTRRFENFHIKKYDTRYGFADFFRRGLLKYNEIPDNLKRLKTLGVFKNRLKELTFDQYEHENDFA
ncbi:CLUMA_CG016633, isoform A [Clunio marinus]|uniref:CLUMA_CG016633, isoform A n=1 Tax=Clunio marinus TaxID=568069 RepID=A0A1J1ITH9_9DIPT|nr:CLUMA_CG016633, isoform A [Clunio marinus]